MYIHKITTENMIHYNFVFLKNHLGIFFLEFNSRNICLFNEINDKIQEY